jgi:adsorption protein B
MFPAWKEADVIGVAVANILATLDYSRFEIFIGVYPNDPDTDREATKLVARFPNVFKVVTTAPGPTCKADCLNHIIRAIYARETETGIEFAGCIMQDAEDIVHPAALRLFNWLCPHYDLVQTPVFSLRRKWWELTAGHYMEEFAEAHARELPFRQHFAGIVPGCGVGTCYSRRALRLAESTGETFSTSSLTEDYEFSFRVRDAGLRMVFARVAIPRQVPRNGWFASWRPTRVVREYIGTSEFFPDRFRAAYRQKARWTIGISLQAWRSFGWRGSWRIKYLFWRDRRGLFLSHVTVAGFMVLAAFAGLEVMSRLWPQLGRPAPLLAEDDPMWWLVYFNLGLLAIRLIQRHFAAWWHYGAGVLPMVTIRYFWGGIVNYFALWRALTLWARHLRTGVPIGWDKTTHLFPTEMELALYRRRLGDLLLERKLLSFEQLERAAEKALSEGRLLGEVLLDEGLVREGELTRCLALQFRVQPADTNPFQLAEALLRSVPLDLARLHLFAPVERTGQGVLVLAFLRMPTTAAIEEIERKLTERVEVRLGSRSLVHLALSRMAAQSGTFVHGWGSLQTILESQSTSDKVVMAALDQLRDEYRPFGWHARELGLLSDEAIETASHEAASTGQPLGEYLISCGFLTHEQRAEILSRMERPWARLQRLTGGSP